MAGSLLCLVVLAGCSEDPLADAEAQPHSHGPGQEMISLLVGDGTRAEEVGYTLDDVSLPERVGEPGEVGFTIRSYPDDVQTDFIPEQTKDLHLYVVRDDLAVFRHLHPTMASDGTWTAPLTLPEAGDYRVIVEFVARDSGGNGDFLMLGRHQTVPGEWTRQPADAPDVGDDGTVNVRVTGEPRVSNLGQIQVVVRDAAGRPVKLGTYLGTFAHVTGFHVESGSAVHLHPLGQPEVEEDGTRLTFHTEFVKPGDYVCFVQVRVDGFLHTLPVKVTVSGADASA